MRLTNNTLSIAYYVTISLIEITLAQIFTDRMTTFSDLNLSTPLLNALNDLGYTQPTTIQHKAFSVIMSGKDMVGVAQTGTGKTLAYLLPLLRMYKYSESKHPRVLIVVPTRELVIQVLNELKKLTPYMNLRCEGVYGGTNMNTQKQLVYNGLDILIATPGRLIDLAMCGVLRLTSVQKLVIDEVDEMLNLGFRAQLTQMLDLLPDRRQNIMFSATLTEDVEKVMDTFCIEPQKVEAAPHGTPLDKIEQHLFHVPNFNTKIYLLEYLLRTKPEMDKVLVFGGTKRMVDEIFAKVSETFPDKVGIIHSNRAQNQRFNAIRRFKDGEHRVLIATDIIARGLDVANVSHVINFDTPDEPGDYLHRIGRTGRADKTGIAYTFVNEKEKKLFANIEKLMNKTIEAEPLPADLIISEILTDDEKPSISAKNYLPPIVLTKPAAFQEKKAKNKKVNLGGPGKRNSKFVNGKRVKAAKPGAPTKNPKIRF